MAYLTDTKPEEKSSPSQILLENGLVISFYIRYDHRSVHHYRNATSTKYCISTLTLYWWTIQRIGILTLYISRIYGLGPSHSSASYYVKSKSIENRIVTRTVKCGSFPKKIFKMAFFILYVLKAYFVWIISYIIYVTRLNQLDDIHIYRICRIIWLNVTLGQMLFDYIDTKMYCRTSVC